MHRSSYQLIATVHQATRCSPEVQKRHLVWQSAIYRHQAHLGDVTRARSQHQCHCHRVVIDIGEIYLPERRLQAPAQLQVRPGMLPPDPAFRDSIHQNIRNTEHPRRASGCGQWRHRCRVAPRNASIQLPADRHCPSGHPLLSRGPETSSRPAIRHLPSPGTPRRYHARSITAPVPLPPRHYRYRRNLLA